MPEHAPVVTRTREAAIQANPQFHCEPMIGEQSLRRKERVERTSGVKSRWDPGMSNIYPTWLIIPERERTLLDQGCLRFPTPDNGRPGTLAPPHKIFNVSQSHVSLGDGVCPCITPSGHFWVENRGRVLEGSEMLRLQGIILSDHEEWTYSTGFLQHLAGNAFSPFCVSISLVICLTISARLHAAAILRLQTAAALPSDRNPSSRGWPE